MYTYINIPMPRADRRHSAWDEGCWIEGCLVDWLFSSLVVGLKADGLRAVGLRAVGLMGCLVVWLLGAKCHPNWLPNPPKIHGWGLLARLILKKLRKNPRDVGEKK